jgi:hypothetical protein
MNKLKRICRWIIRGLGITAILGLTLVLLAPWLINLEVVKEKFKTDVSMIIGGKVEYQRVDLLFFPRPRVLIHQVSLTVPEIAVGTLKSLRIYPAILPLLKGQVQIARLQVDAPDFEMELPQKPEKERASLESPTFEAVREKVTSFLERLAKNAPDVVVIIKNGNLGISQGTTNLFSFQGINAQIISAPKELKMIVTCNSNLSDTLRMEGDFHPKALSGKGEIALKTFRPQKLARYLFPDATHQIGKSIMNLDATFTMDGLRSFHAAIQGSIPHLTFHRANEESFIKAKALQVAFHLDKNKATVALEELDLEHPQMHLTGELTVGHTSPRISLALKGRGADVRTTRKVALAMFGYKRTIQDVFKTVKGGQVPQITIKSQADLVPDLDNKENLFIQGQIVDGKIFVPKANLDLKDVKGDVVISNGVLQGENLEARMGNSRGHQGALKLKLKRKSPPFHLDTMLHADLAQLPPILKRLVRNKPFIKEVSLIRNLEGNASGRLIVDKSPGSTKTNVEVSEFNLSGTYERIPYPLEVRGGFFHYAGKQVRVTKVRGKLPQTSFSDLSASVQWEKGPSMQIESGKFSIVLDEVYPWLSSYKKLRNSLFKNFKPVKGVVELSALSMKGPVLKPRKWEFKSVGQVKKLTADMTLFPEPVTAAKGNFTATPKELSFEADQTDVLGDSLKLSGTLTGYLEGIVKTDLTFSGQVGLKGHQWLEKFVRMPLEVNIRPPLNVSKAHLVWNKGGKVSFEGMGTVQKGPRISLKLDRNPQELTVEDLSIEDEESHAFLAIKLKKEELYLKFTGNLTQATLDRGLATNNLLSGRIRGDLTAHIFLDQPVRSRAQGKLEGENVVFPWKVKKPVKINRMSLNAEGNLIKVHSADLIWRDKRFATKGTVKVSAEGLRLDLDLSTDRVDWDNMKRIMDKDSRAGDAKQPKGLWDIPVQGVLRFKSEHFKYDSFTWSPFHADVSFEHEDVHVAVREAKLCGISFPGVVKTTPQDLSLDFNPVSKGESLDPTLACLWEMKREMTGQFDLKGKLLAQGKNNVSLGSFRGNLEFLARDGRIYRYGMLAKICTFLNITSLFGGELGNLDKKGFAYNSIKASGELQNGKLFLKEAIIDSPSLHIAFEGDIDLLEKKLDLKVLVSPLKNVDAVVKHIPVVGKIFNGTLVTIPVEVEGDWADPTVIPLSPAGIGSGLLSILRETLQAPFKIVEPIFPKEKGKRRTRVLPRDPKLGGQNK